MATPPLPPKKDVMLALLERSSVFVHLDPRAEGVRVPPWFRGQHQLVLQVGLNMAVRIPDLSVEDDAVGCTLSFNRSPFYCFVPWGAVFALVGDDGKGMVWPDDVPPEVAAQHAEQARKNEARARLQPADASPGASGAIGAKETPAAPFTPRTAKPAAKKAIRAARAKAGPARASGGAKSSVGAPGGGASEGGKRPLPPYLRIVK